MTASECARQLFRSPAWYLREHARAATAHAERDVAYWRQRLGSDPETAVFYHEARDRELKTGHAFTRWDGYVWSAVMRKGFDPDDPAFPDDEPIVLDRS